ncbi:MAG: hypothetical protein K2Y21_13365 [Phycisphaerales bacterium]|nr:hypothetical protein [Phycisphaerales bacterium]
MNILFAVPIAFLITSASSPTTSIDSGILSDDVSVRNAAVEQIVSSISTEPTRIVEGLRSKWLRQLLERGDNDAVAKLSLLGALTLPQFEQTAEQLFKFRAEAFLAMNRVDEALSAAKSCFNVSTMYGFHDAVTLVSRCLAAKSQGLQSDLAALFRIEQVRMLDESPTRNSESVLASITVDYSLFESQIRQRQGAWFGALLERGNLLLMADRNAEALKCFQDAIKIATPQQKASAQHAVARALKAVNGGIGPANNWIRSLAPELRGAESR